MYVFIVFIYLQESFVIKDQFSLDFKDFNWRIVSVPQNINAYEWV